MKILLTEHEQVVITCCEKEETETLLQIKEADFASIGEDIVRLFKRDRGRNIYPFLLQRKNEHSFLLQADYYIGVDWLISGVRYVQVEPKVNVKASGMFDKATDDEYIQEVEELPEKQKDDADNESEYVEVDYLKMLMEVMSAGLKEEHTRQLVLIDWQAKPISITQKEDRLTPFLIVQFLQLLKNIVRKGLKKSYYKQRESLNNKVKGKILVGDHIKRNILKNRLTNTYCEYQVFGEDNIENRFLKKVLRFAAAYIENNKACFASNFTAVEHMLNYCRPAFEHISNDVNEHHLKQIRHNPFFNEYKEAITIGKYILKKFAYNITETSTLEKTTPPFWIDMPRLFELYCYVQILKDNPEDKHHIHYQFSTYGNSLDILISKPGYEMVIDTKYKLKYNHGHIHQDIRQVAGYARLEKVRSKLKISDDRNIDCLIIYPDLGVNTPDYKIKTIHGQSKLIPAYYKMHKLGWVLPLIKS